MVLKELILNSFYFGRVWWSWKNWFWTVYTLQQCGGRCGGHERTDFEQFLLWEGMMVLKELILNSFYFGTVWWSSKTWFQTVSTLGGCGGRCGGVVVMKELILNSFYFGKVWWSWKNWFWTVSTLGRYDGLEKLILNSLYFGRVWWSWKNWFWMVSTLGRYDGLERTDFKQFLLWDSVMVLKELILNSFYLWRCGGIEITYGRCIGKHWGHTRGVWTYGGVGGTREIGGCPNAWGIQTYGGVKKPPNIWGCQPNAPRCRTYMPLKKIRGVWTYRGVEMDREALEI